MSLEDEIRKKFGKMQKISLDRLTPPMAPLKHIFDQEYEMEFKPISSEQSETPKGGSLTKVTGSTRETSLTDSKLGIDYEEIARSSEFQRFIYFLLTGKTHRGKQVDLRRDVTAKMTKFRGSGMGDVINEFKAKVARLREK